jgi:pyridoxal phosphate enzyme (YggS family)
VAVSAPDHDIVTALRRVQDRITSACASAGRAEASVRLIAVSKRHPAEAIRIAYAAGQREFGENYVQELVGKADTLTDLPDLRLRLIGHLQRNKAKDVTRLKCAVDTVDSVRLAAALNERAGRDGVVVEVLLQVNVAREEQKSGALPELVPELVEQVRAMPHLSLRGLMTIPPDVADPNQSRVHFAALREIASRHQLPELSMGMSGDIEAAILEGSTMVRVGTAIFGVR